jgi:CHAD domain-containing protein
MSPRVDPSRPLDAEMRRLLADEIGKAKASLEKSRTDPNQGIHETRKRIKKIRALLRLVRSANKSFYAAENARYRDISRSLAGARQATALVETLDRFMHEFPRQAAGLTAMRARLAERCPTAGDTKLAADIAAALAACEAGEKAASRFRATGARDAAEVFSTGVRKALKRAERSLAAATESRGAEDFHDLRKAVKTHAAQLSLLADVWLLGRRKRVNAADELGTALGDLNDLAVISDLVDKAEEALGSEKEVAALQKLIRRKKKGLSKDTLSSARALFDMRPKDAAARLAKAYREAIETPAAGLVAVG